MIHSGDLFDVLPTLDAESVHCVVTSPPYWGLRDYGNPPRIFGGDPSCDHAWGEESVGTEIGGGNWAQGVNGRGEIQPGGVEAKREPRRATATRATCSICGAWRGCLGLEPTPEMFVEHMVQAFAEVHRVLREDGTLWLNMGDCYATGAGAVGEHPGGGAQGEKWKSGYKGDRNGHEGKHHYRVGPMTQPNRLRLPGYKAKDLIGVPWMLAFALRSAGWYLRAEIVWAKGISFCDTYAGSVMPESVQDRPTRGHEQVFLLTKRERYFYDAEAVKETGSVPAGTRAAKGSNVRSELKDVNGRPPEYWEYNGLRNLRTVWAISPKPFAEAHFATFPLDLVVPCVKAGTSEKGVCAACGAPWRRVVEKEPIPDDVKADFEAARQRSADDHGRDDGFTTRRPNFQRGRGATTSPKRSQLRDWLIERQGEVCAYCSATGVFLEIEHMLPRSRGGTDDIENLTLACISCNRAKGTRTAEEFRRLRLQ